MILKTIFADAWGAGSSKRVYGAAAMLCLIWISLNHPASDALVTGLVEIVMVCVVGITSERFSRAVPKPDP